MDWTNVFEEDGDETFFINQQLTLVPKAPRLARLVSKLYHLPDDGEDEVEEEAEDLNQDISEHRLFQFESSPASFQQPKSSSTETPTSTSTSAYTLRALYYLSINYILGVGCLGIPYAFARAGFILCISILLVVTFSSYVTVMWVAECGERYHEYWCQRHKQQQQRQITQNQPCISEASPLLLSSQSNDNHTAENQLVDVQEDDHDDDSADENHHQHKHHHQHWDRYEVVDLVGFYLGGWHKILYQVSLMALMYIGLLAYTQVFCLAVTELIWGSKTTAMAGLPQFVFALMVVPLSCVELDEQISVQSIMAMVRFLAIFIILFGSLLALFLDDSNAATTMTSSKFDDDDDYEQSPRLPPYFASPESDNCQMSYTVCLSGFGQAFSTSLFSQLFQHSVPGLLRPLRDQPSKHSKVPKTLGASLLTTLSFYLLLGTSAASFFGASTRSSINLNFAGFTMGLDASSTSPIVLAAVKMAANIVVIFPALDTISVFPLIANTLGNNLWSAAVGPKTIRWCARALHAQHNLLRRVLKRQSSDSQTTPDPHIIHHRSSFNQLTQEEQKRCIERASRLTTVFWRLVAALPPLLGSLVAADLSFSLLLAGVAGVYVAFFAPSLMQLKSLSRMATNNRQTIFSGWYSSTLFCYPVLAFATFSVGAVLAQIKSAWIEMSN